MKAVFYNIYRVLRTIIVFGIVAPVAIFLLLYLVLLIPSIQNGVKSTAEEELSKLLNTEVSIERLSIEPFNKVVLYDVDVPDKCGRDMLKLDKLGAGFSFYNLLMRGRIVFTYAELIGLNGNIYRESPHSETNLQFVIDALSSKDKTKPSAKYDVSIYNIVLRKSGISYNILSDTLTKSGFNKNHINISDLRADIALPRIKNDDYYIKIKRLSFEEQCGLVLKNLTINTKISDKEISVSDFRLELANSYIQTDDFSFSYGSLKTLKSELEDIDWNLNMHDSYVTLSDLSCFLPQFSSMNEPIHLSFLADGTLKQLDIPKLNIRTDNKKIELVVNGAFENLNNPDSLELDLSRIYIKANAGEVINVATNFVKLTPTLKKIINNSGNVVIDGSLNGLLKDFDYQGKVSTKAGKVVLDGRISNNGVRKGFKGLMQTDNFNVGSLLGISNLLGETSFDLSVDGNKSMAGINASVEGDIRYIDFKGYRYDDITTNLIIKPSEYAGYINVNDDNLSLKLDGLAVLKGEDSKVDANMIVSRLNLHNTNINNKYPNHELSFTMKAVTHGNQVDNLNGLLNIENLCYVDSVGEGIKINTFEVIADNSRKPYVVDIKSDIVNGKLEGYYKFDTFIPTVKHIISQVYPSLIENSEFSMGKSNIKNDFNYTFNIENNDITNSILKFFNSPLTLLYPVSINGFINETNNAFDIDLNAPYLAKKTKLIEGSRVVVGVDSLTSEMNISANTIVPTKNGKIALSVVGKGGGDRLNTNIGWKVDREGDFHGDVNLSVALGRVNETNSVMSTIDVKPTKLVFNDTIWNVHESRIGIYNKSLRVDDFRVTSDNQFVWIDGKSTRDSIDNINVELKNINLDYIFNILQINNVNFGGSATGKILASEVLSGRPKLETEKFFVKDLSYNSTLLGDADMRSFWDNDKKFVAIQAFITQPNGFNSEVDGEIYPMNDSLRFDFSANKLKAGFMQPFLATVTSDIDGYATGNVRLFGKFRNLDLMGDVFVEDLKIKIDYTNVCYWATDTIKIVPGEIRFDNVLLKDKNGHTAKLTGLVTHEKFKNTIFKFDITEAENLLCYDIPEKKLDDWYGTIYGNGSVFIDGEPGVVSIDVRMETAANSKFYFELSDSQNALEYDFITFTDKRKSEREAELVLNQSNHDIIINNFKQDIAQDNVLTSRIIISIKVDINPLGQMILIMDPAGGDQIKATGNGNIALVYDSNSDLEIRGKYTLEKGLYNFTLQDIIIKDFTIREGSSITFDGDPLNAKIDIAAAYALNANLQDLDESFATDKELNRTNVPVHALLKLTGSITAPEINFDLELPTLSSDAYRKVKSIVSTDDMMNRQIIYLLALNRFYTPEYMGGTNRGNELASVASSTISSQLSSMLGQISDKWSIAPNFKSDKGDFSDVEVNLALSSQLLNNRLLLNGNFGYRDKMTTTSNTNFIGDFDIEYLLNKAGNIRLKAYNHFNDQNYYVKNALTTQGVGVVFKYDFDRLFRSSKHKLQKKQSKAKIVNKQDSIILEK